MEIKFNKYYETVDPFRNHKLRMDKGYRPKYRSGLIAVRFLDDEQFNRNMDFSKTGFPIDFQEIFSVGKSYMGEKERKYIDFFEKKYGIKLSNYRSGTDDFYIYFSCEPGKEKEKMKLLSEDPIIKDIDFVDTRELNATDELEIISRYLNELSEEASEISNEEFKERLSDYIERLKNLL